MQMNLINVELGLKVYPFKLLTERTMIKFKRLLLFILLIPSQSKSIIYQDYSKKGALEVEVIEFKQLTDPTREKVNKSGRFKFLRRINKEEQSTAGRKIPIKVHVPKNGGPYPLIIISHGAGGNWDTHYAQANHLASHGFAVLCLEHTGSNTEKMKESFRILQNLKKMIHDSPEVLGRPKDITYAINKAYEWIKSNQSFASKLDITKIGVMGHSFGAYTTLAIAGARPALDWIVPKVGSGSGLGPDLSDGRVNCGVALSPQGPGDPFFLTQSYESLRIPIMGISGTKDHQQNGDPAIVRYESFKFWPEMKKQNMFLWLTNAGHLDFTDSTGGEQHGRESSTRKDVQSIVRAATLLYFNECLKPSQAQENELNQQMLEKYINGEINKLELRKK
jgi:predicted dienelactone hydrolase